MTVAASDRKRSLDARPATNPGLVVKTRDDGCVTLVVPATLTKRPRWQKAIFLLPREGERKVDLDVVGSFVWGLCDGEHRVRDVILALAERYQFSRREAEVSVLGYLRNLGERGFIGMKIGEDDGEESEPR